MNGSSQLCFEEPWASHVDSLPADGQLSVNSESVDNNENDPSQQQRTSDILNDIANTKPRWGP